MKARMGKAEGTVAAAHKLARILWRGLNNFVAAFVRTREIGQRCHVNGKCSWLLPRSPDDNRRSNTNIAEECFRHVLGHADTSV